MATIERSARPATARHEQAHAAQRRLCWGARWVSSFRGDCAQDFHSSLRPEEVARGELFYSSTGCWV